MRYKLVAVDIDGTLLNSQGIITDKTRSSIQKAVDKGIVFSICTGRPIQGVERFNSLLDLDSPYITYNGAMIVMGRSKEILYEQGLSAEAARSIMSWGKKFQTTIMVWSNNQLYASELNARAHDYKKLSGVEPLLIDDEKTLIHNGVTKILWYDDIDKIDLYQGLLKNALFDNVNYYTSKPTFLEFVDKRVSKANAMEKLGTHFGISSEEMIAIGDGFNDLSMIEYAGMGVAMGNAPQAIRDKANFVTLTNDEDGIAYALEKFIIGNV